MSEPTFRRRIYPWRGPRTDALLAAGKTVPEAPTQLAFEARVVGSLATRLGAFVGPVALDWLEDELSDRGRPRDRLTALALAHALAKRVPDRALRLRAHDDLETVVLAIDGPSERAPASSR